MAQVARPVPAERMAVLETSEFPGSESTMDCAFLLGSSDGTFEARRAGVRVRDVVGRVRGMIEGRSERAPVAVGQCLPLLRRIPYQWHSESVLTTLLKAQLINGFPQGCV